MSIEQYTRDCIRNDLENKKWIFDKSKPNCNVTQEQAKTPLQQKKLKGNRPDYVLYETNTDNIIAIIEAKHGGYTDLNQALNQAEKYAKLLQSNNKPIVLFATNGSIYQTRFFPSNDPLIFNRQEVKGLLEEDKLLLFINGDTNEIDTTPKEIIKSKEDLIKIFKNLNDVLRSEGLRAGIERFTEFSNLLFLKLISEHNQKPWWEEIKQHINKNKEIINYINKYILEQIQGEYGGEVLTPISIKNENTLKHIIHAIDPLVFSTIDTDIKGDAFEYFLEKTTSTENDLGEYFTPRHVVKAIVDFVSPKYNEKIYDPFCGTGGFLTNAFHYVRENNNLNKEEEHNLKSNSIYGHEITTTAKTAKMNMILQGDGHSGIQQLDSLFNPIDKEYDLIITNIPFSQKIVKKVIIDGKEHSINEVTEKYENGLAKNSGDAVCVLHCFRALKEGGRMALVVPEGFLFRNVEKYTRRFLLDNSNLEAVISLPQGTFLPYTAVKTSILYFTNVHNPQPQKEFWYYEAKNIGFSLDNHRRVIHGFNDLDMIKSSINKFKKAQKDEDIKKGLLQDGFQLINLKKVIDNNYNLVGGIYRDINQQSNFELVTLDNLIKNKIITGQKGKIITKQTAKKGSIPVIAGGKTYPYYHNQANFLHETITISASGAAGFVWYHNYPIWASDCSVIYSNSKKQILTKYLYYVLKSQQEEIYKRKRGTSQPHVYLSDLKNIKIPLPRIEQQEEIVNELDSYHKIIDGCQQVIDNWKPQFKIKESWKLIKIEDVADINPKKNKIELKSTTPVSFLPMEDVGTFEIEVLPKQEKIFSNINKGYTYFSEGDLLIAKIAPCFENGKMSITRHLKNGIGFGSTEFIVVRVNSELTTVKWVYYCLRNLNFIVDGIKIMTGSVGHQRISADFVRYYKIPIPSINIQQKIIERIEFERNIIEQNKKLVEIYNEKVADKLNKLFN